MVISRAVRPRKKVLEPKVDTSTRMKKESTRDKVIKCLKKNKKGLPLMELAYQAGVRSGGNLSQTIKFMIRAEEIVKESCPHCNSIMLYKLHL